MTKETERRIMLSGREIRTPRERREIGTSLMLQMLSLSNIRSVRRIASYISMPDEPGTDQLHEALSTRNIEVVVPRIIENHAMEWVLLDLEAPATVNMFGVREPSGAVIDNALETVDFIIVPSLSVDFFGNRLGRGKGYYDRALAHATRPIYTFVYYSEITNQLPTEDHDVRVDRIFSEIGEFPVRTQSSDDSPIDYELPDYELP